MNQDIPKSAEQSIKFFEEFIRKDYVQDFVLKLRKETGVPEKGISFEDKDSVILEQETGYFLAYSPTRFKNSIWKDYATERKMKTKIFIQCINFMARQNIDSAFISSMFRLYFYFNKTLPYYPKNLFTNDLLKLEEIDSMLFWYDPNNDKKILSFNEEKRTKPEGEFERYKSLFKKMKSISEKYPLALYINPNISQRQLIDFISKSFNEIKKHRKENKFNLNKVRTKRKQEQNDFIYKNKNLPLKDIRGLLADKKIFLDDGLIGKIKANEIKRRS